MKKKTRTIVEWSLLVAVVAALAATLYFFVRDTAYMAFRNQSIGQHRLRHSLQPQDIAGWMTFHFINRLFRLPDNYLQQQFNITDKKYPNLTLSAWAKAQHLNSAQFFSQVQRTVASYH